MTELEQLCHRLRACKFSAPEDHPVHPKICDEAATHIEELTRQIEVERITHAKLSSERYTEEIKLRKRIAKAHAVLTKVDDD